MSSKMSSEQKERENICKALRSLDWSGVPIGHKAIIKAAIAALEAQNTEARDPSEQSIVPFYNDSTVGKRMTDQMRNFLQGMQVSVDVSDPNDPDDMGDKRLFGTVDCVEDNPGKHHVSLLVWDPKPNFKPKDKKVAPIKIQVSPVELRRVPVKPTDEMIIAAAGRSKPRDVYTMMVAEAPDYPLHPAGILENRIRELEAELAAIKNQ